MFREIIKNVMKLAKLHRAYKYVSHMCELFLKRRFYESLSQLITCFYLISIPQLCNSIAIIYNTSLQLDSRTTFCKCKMQNNA